MDNRIVSGLLRISKPKSFSKGQYICREGEAGTEMYIVLSGSVGVYINSVLEDYVQIATVGAGGFFGEMAIVDQKPRSAAGIALADTQCIAINQDSLKGLIVNCPDVALTLMSNLSGHIRELNDKLFKKEAENREITIKEFDPPMKRHDIQAPPTAPHCLKSIRVSCPVCGKKIIVQSINFNDIKPAQTEDFRTDYEGFDVRWHYIWNCPECGYTNFFSQFFIEYAVPHGDLLRCLGKQNQFYTFNYRPGSVFDRLVFDYYRAIHLNECLVPEGKLLLAKLWLSLYWLYTDAGDSEEADKCRLNALRFYESAYALQTELNTSGEKQKCAMIIAELYYAEKNYSKAHSFYTKVLEYPGKSMKAKAQERLSQLHDDNVSEQGKEEKTEKTKERKWGKGLLGHRG